jgi:hypothetical protein
MMLTPVFERRAGKYIILQQDYISADHEKALAAGVVGQMYLFTLDYSFTGEIKSVNENTEYFLVVETLPDSGTQVRLGLIGGQDYLDVKNGKKPDDYIFTADAFINDRLYIVEIIAMNDETNLTIGIGMQQETYEPYVLLMKDETGLYFIVCC